MKIVKIYPHYKLDGYWKTKFEKLYSEMQTEGLGGFHVYWSEDGRNMDEEGKCESMYFLLLEVKNRDFDDCEDITNQTL